MSNMAQTTTWILSSGNPWCGVGVGPLGPPQAPAFCGMTRGLPGSIAVSPGLVTTGPNHMSQFDAGPGATKPPIGWPVLARSPFFLFFLGGVGGGAPDKRLRGQQASAVNMLRSY